MKKVLIWATAVGVLAAGIYFARPLYRDWKEERFLRQARAFLEQKDLRNASLSARQAHDLNPNNVETCRILAQIAETFRSPLAISWRQRIVTLEPAVTQNRLDLARCALLQGNYGLAGQTLGAVDKAGQGTAEFHEMAAMVAMAANHIALADYHFGEARRLEPDNKLLELNQAVIHLQAKNPQLVAQAQRSLERLYADPTYRRDALRHLVMAAVAHKDFERAELFSKELLGDADAPFQDRLMHLTVLKEAGSKGLEGHLAQLESEAAREPDRIYELASWLVSHRMADEGVKWLRSLPAEVRSRPPGAMALADCHVALADWAALEALLREQTWAALDFLRLAQLARAGREQKQPIASQADWRAAVRAADNRVKPLATLARMANAWGWEQEKEELLWTIVQRYPGERWALQSLNQLYTAAGNARGLHKVYATLVNQDASDIIARNNLASLSLLLNLQVARAHEMAREVHARYPQNDAFASTYAYSLHLQGRTQEGLKVLEALPVEKLENPAIAVYYAVLLAAAEQPAKAKKYFALAETGNLLAEEKALIAAARTAP